jgi:hypothetical protein
MKQLKGDAKSAGYHSPQLAAIKRFLHFIMAKSNRNINSTDRSGSSAKWFNPDTRWTLLFVGNRGKPIALKHFKRMVFITLMVIIVSVGIGVGMYFWNRDILREKSQLEVQLKSVEEQNQKLRDERDILMTRLVLVESRIQGGQESLLEKQVEEEIPATDLQVAADPEYSDPPALAKAENGMQNLASMQPANSPPSSGLSVAIDNFKVGHRSGSNSLRLQFKLKNTSPFSQHVAGHAIVVLKGKAVDQSEWLALPDISLVDGKPTGSQQGNAFGISNFRVMKFKTRKPPSPEKFQTASIYVFTKTGELLLEQDFPVELVR